MSRKQIGFIGGGVVAIIIAVVVAAFALSGGAQEKAAPPKRTTTSSSTTSTEAPPPAVVAPLTGLPVDAPITRPALVVKIDNADKGARPQVGLESADIVYEEKVEGGVTRFAAVFHSQDANPVGPVRSGRTTDIGIVFPLNRPLYAYSGANTIVEGQLATAPLINIGAPFHIEPYWRQEGRSAPYNLFSTTEGLWGLAPPDAQPPPALFVYRAADEESKGERVGNLTADFGGGAGTAPAHWEWNAEAKRWLRWQNGTPHVNEGGEQFGAETVVVQYVDYLNSGLVDVSGNASPEAQLVGEGDVWIFSDGKMQAGRWSRPTPEAVTTYTDASGQPLALTPGKTWVELVPIGSGVAVESCTLVPNAAGC